MSNSPVLADQQARSAIEQKLGINLLVEAGAGSGKTEALARRMAAAIASGHCQVEHMAAVTFTRKAAAELRGRFQLCLERRLLQETDSAARERIRKALARLERLFVGTIHAFCAHLLRERPVEAGIAPGFEELDEIENDRMRLQTWRDFLDQERAAGSAALQELLDAGILPQDLDDSFRQVCLYPEVGFPLGAGKKPDATAPWMALEAFWSSLRKLLSEEITEETTCPVQKKAREFRWRFSIADRTKASSLTELLKLWEGQSKVVQKWWVESTTNAKLAAKAASQLVDSFQEQTVQPYLAAWRQYVYRLSLTLLLKARSFASNERRRVSKLNYEDLLQEAARLLRERTDVRIALQQKYRWLFVDEFQDTDPIQAEVIFWLAASADAKHWSEASLRSGALFIVGDPKQSIYRFRRADIDTYQLVRRRIQETGGQILPLTTSFRSTPSLCSWVNRVFPNFFPVEATPAQPAFQPLDPKPGGASNALSLCHLTTPAAFEKAREVATYEAQVIARYIWTEVHSGRRQRKDFLVLTRKKELLPVYQAALEQLQIPVECSGGSAFGQSVWVAILADLLRVLSNPDDSVALVGVLRGPLFGISDPALFENRQDGLPFRLNVPLPDAASGAVAVALRSLQVLYDWTRTLPAPAAVDRILDATGLLALAASSSPGGAEAGNLKQALSHLRRVTMEGANLADAVASLEDDLNSLTEIESVPLEPGRSDVVRLMNLHKAKGLEAAVVFLADPLSTPRERVNVRIVREAEGARGYFQIQKRKGEWGSEVIGEPEGWESHERVELVYQRAEEHRLLYVAATRAKELLVISQAAGAKPNSNGPWRPLEAFLNKAPALNAPNSVKLATAQLPDLRPAAQSVAAALRASRLEKARTASYQVATVTDSPSLKVRSREEMLEAAAKATSEPELIEKADYEDVSPRLPGVQSQPNVETVPRGATWGTLIHRLLDFMVSHPTCRRQDIDRMARWHSRSEAELQPFLSTAVETVEELRTSELWQKTLQSSERLTEVPVAILERADQPPTILHGTVDLLLKSSAGWEIVDYKTDALDAETVRQRYEGQVLQYKQAWESVTQSQVATTTIHQIRHKA